MKSRMEHRRWPLWATLLLAVAPHEVHAVTTSDFIAGTTGQLVALCDPAPNSPMAVAALDFCWGFAQGAVAVEMQHEAGSRSMRLFCLPTPPPERASTLAAFVQWARGAPDHMNDAAADGLFTFLGQRYPCSRTR